MTDDRMVATQPQILLGVLFDDVVHGFAKERRDRKALIATMSFNKFHSPRTDVLFELFCAGNILRLHA